MTVRMIQISSIVRGIWQGLSYLPPGDAEALPWIFIPLMAQV